MGKPTGLEAILEDLSQCRQAEEALRRNGEWFRSLIQNSSDIITLLDVDGTILYESPSIERILGYEPGELVEKNAFDYVHPEDLERVLEVFAQGLADPTLRPALEYRFQHKDGSWRWLESIGANLLDDPDVGELVVNSRDITERKQAYERIAEGERRLSTLLSNAPAYLYRCRNEPTRPNEFVSAYALELTGYTPEDLTNGSVVFGDLIVDKDRQRVREELLAALTERRRFELQYALRRQDGEIRHVEERGQGVYGKDDEVEAIEGVIYDVTGRVQAEEALKEAEDRYRTLVEQIPAVTYINPLSETSRSTYISPQVEELLGYSVEESREDPKLWNRILHPDDRERVIAEEARTSATGEPFKMEYRMIAREGRVVWLRDEAVLVRDGEGKPRFWQGVMLDITERKLAEEALQVAEERYRTLVERIPAITYVQEPAEPSRTTYISPQYEAILGYSLDEVVKNPGHWAAILHPEDRERVLMEDMRTNETGEPFVMEYRQIAQDGGVVWLRDEATLVRDAVEEPLYWLGVQTDITQRKEVEEALREAEQRFRSSFSHAAIGMALVGIDGRWLQVNYSLCEITGYSEEELLARTFQDITHPDDLEADVGHVRRILSGEIQTYQMEKRYFHKVGHEVWVLLSVSLVRDTQGKPLYFIAQIQDIGERKRMEARLQYQALHDPLTELPNRTLLVDRLEHALRRTSRNKETVAVLFMDLDNFKIVNDSLGHVVGDKLLVAVSERLQKSLRPSDTVARLGGDEFAIVLEDFLHGDYPTEVAERILESLRAPFSLEGREVFANASIGIALSSVAGYDGSEVLMRNADAAMYAAKKKAQSSYEVFDQSMNQRALKRLNLENDLRRAIAREDFSLYYQPKVSLATGEILGMEALLRWDHPKRGLILPGEFISLTEQTGLILPIGRWVLEEACHQIQEWHDRGSSKPLLTMCINLSARQFEHPELVQNIANSLEKIGLDPCYLELEITESVLMDDAPLTAQIMRELKSLNVKLSIDDFGTGYSSLSYLQRFPVDYLKIDRSFVAKLGKDTDGEALVSGMIGLAHTLGSKVVAEGVERAEQVAKLREVGCDAAQGYYLAEPLPREAVETLLDKKLLPVGGHLLWVS